MLGIHHYWLFIATAVLLIITPGQDTFFILGRSLSGGRGDGIAAALGVSAGTVIHTLLAALGLSALLATSPHAFTVVKFAGAAYLIYIGARALLSRATGLSGEGPAQVGQNPRHWASFRQGVLTNLLNPKVALFFLAFLPQFIDANAPNKALAFVALGTVFAFNGTIVNVAFAALVARVRQAFNGPHSVGRWVSRGVGALFVALGVRLALFEGRSA